MRARPLVSAMQLRNMQLISYTMNSDLAYNRTRSILVNNSYALNHCALISPIQAVVAFLLTRQVSATNFQLTKPYQQSRASAAALSTVLRTTTLSYGNIRFSGTCPAETPQPIKMKIFTIDYVGEITRCAKNGCNRLAGGRFTDR
jgi:hypothetical protein